MTYKQKNLQLQYPLAFWQAFADQERVFWYDQQQNQLIIAAVRECKLQSEDEIQDYPYVFTSFTFFEPTSMENGSEFWQDFGNERLAFKHYFVQTPTKQTYYFSEQPREIMDIPVESFHHQLTQMPENLSNWKKLFTQIQENIQADKVKKVVASREVIFESSTPFHIESILQNLIRQNPACITFAYQKGNRTFLGSTPEILVQKKGKYISSFALAGTISKTIPNAAQILLADPKNRVEHQIVIDKIRKKMQENAETVSTGPTHILDLKNVLHLKTALKAENSERSLLDWVKILHPTPALGGEPSEFALRLLRENEGYERGLYAAPIGIVAPDGDGTFAVGIRSALILDNQLHAFAGGGIVANSQLDDELRETQLKLKTILEAL